MDKQVNSSKNLAGNRVQLHKTSTLLNEWIFQWHSPFSYGNLHKKKVRLVVHKLLSYT